MPNNITVFGATGMIGRPVTQALVKAGFQVTALVRNVEKSKKLLPEGVTLVQGDLDNKASIVQALQLADGIYINISTTPGDKENAFNPETQGLDNIIEVAKSMNIKQVAYLSSFLARNYEGDWWVFKAKKSSIVRVKQSGLPYTIFYPSNFMENFANGMIRNGKIMVPKIDRPNKAWWIAGSDFGAQVARAFQTEASLHREYPVQGSEAMTMEEAAQAFAGHYPLQQLKVSAMPLGMMKVLSWFIPSMSFVAKLMDVMLHNKESFEAQKTWEELGKPALSVATFAQASKQ